MKQKLEILLNNSQKELNIYVEILKKWQKAVNLISPSTINDIWKRHVIDSAQLYLYIPDTASSLIDVGSGAGFPALVIAILNKINQGPLKEITLVESDLKKCLFLKEVIRTLSLPVQVINQRIEKTQNIIADVITARALASLNQLLKLSKNFIHQNTICLFLKGENVDQEIKNNSISCHVEKIKSITNSKSSILKIEEIIYD